MPMRMGIARVIASVSIGISYLVGGPSWGVRPEKAPGMQVPFWKPGPGA